MCSGLQQKLSQSHNRFYLFKVLRAHMLPLTNVAFNKSGSRYVLLAVPGFNVVIILHTKHYRFITGSYDRTCKLWDTQSGEELQTLEGHKNVVYAIGFNNPYG